jgi:hypothetical protein
VSDVKAVTETYDQQIAAATTALTVAEQKRSEANAAAYMAQCDIDRIRATLAKVEATKAADPAVIRDKEAKAAKEREARRPFEIKAAYEIMDQWDQSIARKCNNPIDPNVAHALRTQLNEIRKHISLIEPFSSSTCTIYRKEPFRGDRLYYNQTGLIYCYDGKYVKFAGESKEFPIPSGLREIQNGQAWWTAWLKACNGQNAQPKENVPPHNQLGILLWRWHHTIGWRKGH